jgi:F-type H+/Na+-transporting ATPase subunit alpha
LTELLKQDLATPYDVVDQIIVIFAGTSGVLDDIPNDSVKAFEIGLLAHVKDKYPDVFESIKSTKAISPEVDATMKKAVAEFRESFTS